MSVVQPNEAFVKPSDVAREVKCSPPTVRHWIRTGRLPAVRLGGPRGHYRVRRRDLEMLIETAGVR